MQRRDSQVSGSSRSPSQSPNEGTPLFAGPGGIPRVGSSCTPSPNDSPRGGVVMRTAVATPLMKQPLSAVLSRPGSVSDWLCGSEDTDSGDDEAAPGLPRTRQVRRSMEVLRATQLHKAYVTQRQLQALAAGEHGTPPSMPATPLSHASSASQAPPPPPPLFRNAHALLRVMSFLDPPTLVCRVFPSCRLLFSLQYSEALWRSLYVCCGPLKFNKIHPVVDCLFAPLQGSGFEVKVLEDRARFHDLYIAMSVCGYQRVLSYAEAPQDWDAVAHEGRSLVATPQHAFAFAAGREIASRAVSRGGGGGVGGRSRSGSGATPAFLTPLTASSSCCSVYSNGSIATVAAARLCGVRTFADVAPRLWKVLFNLAKAPALSSKGNAIRSKMCSDIDCDEQHFVDGTLLEALLHGVVAKLDLPPMSFDVRCAGGCHARVKWWPADTTAAAAATAEASTESAATAFRLGPNLQYYTKSLHLLDHLASEGGAGPLLLRDHVAGLLKGRTCALRRTPAERRLVQCASCGETVSSFDYATHHSRGRCLASAAAAAAAGTPQTADLASSNHSRQSMASLLNSPSTRPLLAAVQAQQQRTQVHAGDYGGTPGHCQQPQAQTVSILS